MATVGRQQREQAFHDRQAQERSAVLGAQANRLVFTDADYLDHETWIRPAFTRLGDVANLRVLDLGCGHGMAGIVLARRGARVASLDLSPGYLAEAARRAQANEVGIDLVRADAERLPFAAQTFDRVWGNAILHHLDVRVAGQELLRVLRPGGWAVLCEPWGSNPMLRWARRRLSYPGKEHTADEEPLRGRDLRALRQIFPRVDVRGYQLLSMARRVLPAGHLVRGLERSDRVLLRCAPVLERWCRYVVLTLWRC